MIPYDFEYWEMRGKQNIMKITEATLEQKLAVLAKLDEITVCNGRMFIEGREGDCCVLCMQEQSKHWPRSRKNYFESYDAIVPLVQKYWQTCSESTIKELFTLCATPEELCNYLLIATGEFEI